MNTLGRISTQTFFDNMSNTTVAQESKMYSLQQQLASGKKINQPSDDPLGSAQVSVIKDQINQNNSFNTTISAALTAIQTTSSAVGVALGQLQNAYQLSVQARNGSYGAVDLAHIGATLSGVLSALVQTANSKDGQSNYIFSGSQTQTMPFQWNGTNYSYNGDQTVAYARTASSSLTQTSWNGLSLFAGALTGDGNVQATANAANAGDGTITQSVQSSPGSYSGASYLIKFTGAGSSLQATVTDTTTAAVVSGPSPFVSGQSLTFGGANVIITGAPVAGDSFTTAPSQRFNVLDAISQLANTLNNSASLSKSQIQNALVDGQTLIASALANLTTNSALMGSEINSLTTQQTAVDNLGISLEMSRSGIEDTDFAKAITEFTAQKTALTASLQSFASISGLSLFNYLK